MEKAIVLIVLIFISTTIFSNNAKTGIQIGTYAKGRLIVFEPGQGVDSALYVLKFDYLLNPFLTIGSRIAYYSYDGWHNI